MYYSGITYPDINNGLGCRVTLWVSGCKHKCPLCHNPETHSFRWGNKYTKESEKKLFGLLEPDYMKGLTLSGGDPMYSASEVEGIVERFRERFGNTKDIWLYTGFKLSEILDDNPWLYQVNYIVDGPYIQEERDLSLAFRGSRNQVIWKNVDGVFQDIDMDNQGNPYI